MLVLSRQLNQGLLLDDRVEVRVIAFGREYADLSVCVPHQRSSIVTLALGQAFVVGITGVHIVLIRSSTERIRLGIEHSADCRVERIESILD